MSTSEIQAEPSVGTADGHENGSGPEAPPARQGDNASDEKKLRALMRQKSVDSTTSLVQAYNGSLTGEVNRLLQQCLRIYSEKKEQCAHSDVVMEYAELCKIRPRTEDDKKLLREVISVLNGRIPDGDFAGENVAEALYRALLWTPPAVLQENLTELTALADKLTASLHPTPRLTEANLLKHEATFMALHQVFVLMQSIARGRVSMDEKKRFQSRLRQKCASMRDSCTYYPVQYHFKLIEQSIQRLKLNEEISFAQNVYQCLYIFTCGFLYTFNIASRLMHFDVDPERLMELPGKLKELVADVDAAERQWYDLVLALCVAGRKTVEDSQKLEIFEDSYKAVEESVWKMRRNADGKALLFGLMQELRRLTLAAGSSEVRTSGSSKLFALVDAVSQGSWVRDKQIVEALLCCLHAVHSRGNDAAATMRSSQQLIDAVKSETVKKAVKQWMGDKQLDEKLREPVHASSEPTGVLFTAIGRVFNHIPLQEARANVELLTSRYRSDEFATVPSLFDDQLRLHVKEMEHHIVFYQIVEDKKESSKQTDSHQSKDDQSTGRRVANSIALEDLFKKRVVKEDRPAQDIRTILFHGKPGSGKTCISKYIGYMWATGQMFKEFDAVYVLPARELNTKEDIEGPSKEFLAFILRQCFPRDRASDKGLCAQVDDHLDLQKTLLIIDGWDEVDKKAEAILNEAKRKQCRVLWLTRPYNLRTMRELTDLEVECLGFSDEQVDRYVKKEMVFRYKKTDAEAQDLMDALRGTASLWEVAHIPVMTYILCFLWTEGVSLRQRSPASMYCDMANHIWDRFIAKVGCSKVNPKRPEVFEALEVVAFDALREDHILISVSFVAKRVSNLEVRQVLRQSGFLLFKKEGVDYQFPHLTFQEYFAERWVAKSLSNLESKDGTTARKFLREEKYLNRYKRTLQFLAQHLAEAEQGDLPELLSFLDDGPIEIIGLQHLLLRLYIVEAWLVGMEDASKIEDCCNGNAVASLIKAAVSLIRGTDVKHREFGEILGRMLQQCPVLFAKAPNTLDQLTETTTVGKALEYGAFGDIVNIAKGSEKHVAILMDLAEQNIQSPNPETRDVGIEMLRKLLDCVPDLFQKFMPLCKRMFVDDQSVVQDTALQAMIGLLADKRELFSKVLPMIQEACASPKSSARRAALEVIGSLSSVTADEFKRVLPMIIERGYDEDDEVCRTALQTMRHFIAETKSQASDLIPVLEHLLLEGDEAIRHETIKTIEYTGRKVPDTRPALLEILENSQLSEEADVRRETAETAGRLAADSPEMQRFLLPAIENACDDKVAAVRLAGMATVKRLAARSDENKNEILHLAAMGFLDGNGSVRRVATEAIACIASVPLLWKNIFMLMRKACSDDDVYLRLWAVDALGRLSSAASHISKDILALLEETCSDDDVHVRQWSMEAIGHLVSAAPELAPDILSLLKTACSDEDEHVRLWVLKAVSRLATAAPEFADDLLPLLRNAYQSDDTHMLNRAAEALKDVTTAAPHLSAKIPTRVESEEDSDAPSSSGPAPVSQGATIDEFEDILKKAIEKKNPKTCERAAFGLLHDAVTVDTTPQEGIVRVFLHTTAVSKVGDYPSEEIEKFRSEMRGTIDSSCSGLLEVLDKVARKPYGTT